MLQVGATETEEVLQHQIVADHYDKQFTFLGLTWRIQITGLLTVALEDVSVLIKGTYRDRFTAVKAVTDVSSFIHISEYVTLYYITENALGRVSCTLAAP
jgi:hypothetical protein